MVQEITEDDFSSLSHNFFNEVNAQKVKNNLIQSESEKTLHFYFSIFFFSNINNESSNRLGHLIEQYLFYSLITFLSDLRHVSLSRSCFRRHGQNYF